MRFLDLQSERVLIYHTALLGLYRSPERTNQTLAFLIFHGHFRARSSVGFDLHPSTKTHTLNPSAAVTLNREKQPFVFGFKHLTGSETVSTQHGSKWDTCKRDADTQTHLMAVVAISQQTSHVMEWCGGD